VIDYTAGPVAEQVRAAYPDGVDALVNLAPGYDPSAVPLAAVRRGGSLASTTALPDEQTLADADVTGSQIMVAAVREVVAPLAEQVAAGQLKVSVADVLPLDQAAAALNTLASGGAGGKLVINIDA
jgi:NADPH:quinone reductase-like Zn-dependent oxidoreductase